MASAADISLVVQWASAALGFDHRALRVERLGEAATREIERLGSGAALAKALAERDPQLVAALVGAVTVGETYFFRQREHFDLLAQLPALRQRSVTAWSAGCSTGEEAYSLAAALRGLTGMGAERLRVWGTDINEASLAQARTADYGRWSWRDTSPAAARVLEAQALEPANRACVRFAKHNLLEAPSFDGGQGERFDLVFCRNVLVYFSPLAAARAVAALTAALKPGAWLVLGNTDLPGAPMGLKRVGPSALCVYAKDPLPAPRSAPPEPAAASPVPAPAPAARPQPGDNPVDRHRRVLDLIDEGMRAAALKELDHLAHAHPDYIPGRFEHALALRRAGHAHAAESELKTLLAKVQGRSLDEEIDGPEPLSLEFYVNSARSFVSSTGGDA